MSYQLGLYGSGISLGDLDYQAETPDYIWLPNGTSYLSGAPFVPIGQQSLEISWKNIYIKFADISLASTLIDVNTDLVLNVNSQGAVSVIYRRENTTANIRSTFFKPYFGENLISKNLRFKVIYPEDQNVRATFEWWDDDVLVRRSPIGLERDQAFSAPTELRVGNSISNDIFLWPSSSGVGDIEVKIDDTLIRRFEMPESGITVPDLANSQDLTVVNSSGNDFTSLLTGEDVDISVEIDQASFFINPLDVDLGVSIDEVRTNSIYPFDAEFGVEIDESNFFLAGLDVEIGVEIDTAIIGTYLTGADVDLGISIDEAIIEGTIIDVDKLLVM